MNPASHDSTRDQQLEVILHAYLQAVDAGQAPDRDAWLCQHPEFASELAAFFADQDKVAQVANGMTGMEVIPSLGTRLRYFGDYELLEEIARGGMGVVYRARQVSLNRLVAVKMLLSGFLADDRTVQRFHKEAEAAAGLDHPHIVPIYEVGEHQGQQYFSMKLIEGTSMARRLAGRNAASPIGTQEQKDAARLLATVARAVHHAHQRGILHRDLKPGNILLDAAGDPHVTDFGLARRIEGGNQLTQSGAIVGTPSYMAPEQAAGKKDLTTLADVYSLGAILYEQLTGRPPFQAETPLDTVLQVVERDPAAPRSLNSHVDADLETICLKCLEKDPSRRYDSAEALADELDRFLAGEPILARPITIQECMLKWLKRRQMVVGLLGLSVAASLAAVAALLGLGGGAVLSLLGGVWFWMVLSFLRQQAQLRDAAELRQGLHEARAPAVPSFVVLVFDRHLLSAIALMGIPVVMTYSVIAGQTFMPIVVIWLLAAGLLAALMMANGLRIGKTFQVQNRPATQTTGGAVPSPHASMPRVDPFATPARRRTLAISIVVFYSIVSLIIGVCMAKDAAQPLWPICLWYLLAGTVLGTLSALFNSALNRSARLHESGGQKSCQDTTQSGRLTLARTFIQFGHFACLGLFLGIHEAYASGLSAGLTVPKYILSGLFVGMVAIQPEPLSTRWPPSVSLARFIRRCLIAWGVLGLLFGVYAASLSGRPLWSTCALWLVIGVLMGAGFSAIGALLDKLASLPWISDEQAPSPETAETDLPQSEGIALFPVDWHMFKGAVVGGLVGLFLACHLADVSGLELWPTCLWGLLAGLPVGAIGAAFSQAYRLKQFGYWVLNVLFFAIFLLGVYRLFRSNDWSAIRSYGSILVGVNVALLALTIGTTLLRTLRVGSKALNSAAATLFGFTCFLAGFASILSAAIAGGQFGAQLGGPIGRGVGESLGAILGLPFVVTVLVWCFHRDSAKTDSSLREPRRWLGFLVLASTNAGVVWLLLR